MNTNDCINDILWAGTFAGDLSYDFATMISTGATDIFIGSLDLLLTDQWFTHEGSGNLLAQESANALDILGSDVVVYGTRTNGGGGTSTFYPGGAGTFSAYPAGVVPGRNEIFAGVFDPTGAALQFNTTVPNNFGPHVGNDITVVGDNTRVAGTLTQILPIDFVDFLDQTAVLHHTLYKQGARDAYLGRLNLGVGLGYYKVGFDDHSSDDETLQDDFAIVFPNPSSIGFTVQFNEEISGEIVVIDAIGRRVLEEELKKTDIYFFGITLQSGVYILQIQSKGTLAQMKLVVD